MTPYSTLLDASSLLALLRLWLPCRVGAAVGSNRADTFRILIATDNHLGLNEKCQERKNDSFEAFEEVLKMAVKMKVDFLLLDGDLFHDNVPSRATMVRTMDMLRKYCIGDGAVRFQVVSDQARNFDRVGASNVVNFEGAWCRAPGTPHVRARDASGRRHWLCRTSRRW